jgi:hypothetical protein
MSLSPQQQEERPAKPKRQHLFLSRFRSPMDTMKRRSTPLDSGERSTMTWWPPRSSPAANAQCATLSRAFRGRLQRPSCPTSRRPDARPSRRLLYRRRRAQQDQHAEEYTTQCYWIRSYINKLNYPERNVILRKPCVELLDRSDLSIVRLSNSASSLHAIRA